MEKCEIENQKKVTILSDGEGERIDKLFTQAILTLGLNRQIKKTTVQESK